MTSNPFPQLARAQWTEGEMALNSLDGDPLKSKEDIVTRLTGKVSDELITLCCRLFKPGQRVHFEIEFEE